MRPLILTITAFGPYATKQVIDFTQLQGRNLFVITGDTGAGKTTILDAISYALYGKASGRDRDGDTLRSHFAAADLLTSVEMEFELRGARYWVERIPKQRRKRTRGEGYTDQNPDAQFKSLDEESRVVSGVKEVNEKIVELMGLSYEQFKQIIMIPQGEFRELLNADSKARQDILQKIFGTEGLRRVQELFESQAKGLVQEVENLENQRDECIRSLDGSNYLPLQEIVEQPNYNVMLVVDEAKQAILMDESIGNGLQIQINEQEEKVAAKLEEIFTGKANNIKIKACDEARQKKISMEADLPKLEEKKQKLEQARKALELVGVDEYQRSRAVNVEKKKVAVSQAAKQEEDAQVTVAIAEEKYQLEQAKESKRNELFGEQRQLQGLAGKVADLDVRQFGIAGLKQELRLITAERDKTKQELQQRREESTLCQTQLDEARVAATEYERKIVELEKVSMLYDKIETLQGESEGLIKLEERGINLEQQEIQQRLQYEKAQREYERAQNLFFEGQAGLLAVALEAGGECPVCGSTHHPKLATVMKEIPSEDELKKLINKDKQARKLYDEVKGNYERNKGDYYAQRQIFARLVKEVSLVVDDQLENLSSVELTRYSGEKLAQYQMTKQELNHEIKQLITTKNGQAELATALLKNTEAISRLGTKLETVENQYTTLFAKVQSAQDAIKKLELEVPVEVRSTAALEKALQGIEDQIEIMKQALHLAQEQCIRSQVSYATAVAEKNGAEKALQEGKEEYKIAYENFMAALVVAGFAGEVEYGEAKLTADQLTSLEHEISDYQEELRSVVDSYAKAQQEIEGLLPVDVVLLETQQQELQVGKNDLIGKRTTIIARQTHNQTMLTSIDALIRKIGKKDEEHQLIGHLSRIAKGDNEQKVSFERYVLAAFFNDIIDAANVRLKKMTSGRYQMSRITQKGKGNGQSGLEIEVFDYYTGQSRHVKTLSGGESFKASLALALGLAEVVQSYAGGISLETMFVDEGFGTLDPESLDTAIGCLIDLQHSGRLVGIISHVPELKTSIDARLEIEACKDGSHAQFYIL